MLFWSLLACIGATAAVGILLTVPTYVAGTASIHRDASSCIGRSADGGAGCFEIRLGSGWVGRVSPGSHAQITLAGDAGTIDAVIATVAPAGSALLASGSVPADTPGVSRSTTTGAASVLVGQRSLAEVFLGRGLRATQ